MVTANLRGPVTATESEAAAIRSLDEVLSSEANMESALIGPRGERLRLPAPVFALLRRMVHELAQGNAVSIAPYRTELTTQQAADLLNVSRPFLIENLLEKGAIPFRLVGKHRRMRLTDVQAYRHVRGLARREALREMLHDAEDDGLYGMVNPFTSQPDPRDGVKAAQPTVR